MDIRNELLTEAAALFRFYEASHRARGPEHAEKAERNAEIATRIESALASLPAEAQGDGEFEKVLAAYGRAEREYEAGILDFHEIPADKIRAVTDAKAEVLRLYARTAPPAVEPIPHCHSGRDGDCSWQHCPQLRDKEPEKTGRHCPFDMRNQCEVRAENIAFAMSRIRQDYGPDSVQMASVREFVENAVGQLLDAGYEPARATPPAVKVPEGWKLIPVEPTEEMWSGLSRAIFRAWDLGCLTPRKLFDSLEQCGVSVPEWLRNEPEMRSLDRVPSKGTRAVTIYKAMLNAAPTVSAQKGEG